MVTCRALLCIFHTFQSRIVITVHRITEYPELYDEHSLHVINSRFMHEYKFSHIHTNQNCARGKI
jgi:hypothetical protein